MIPTVNIYSFLPQTKTLGPFQRFALWVQGCPFRCQRCMTPDALSFDGGQNVAIETLASIILQTTDIEGITISGGEPFAQATALSALMQRLKQQRDMGLIIYSGYKYATLQRKALLNTSEANNIKALLDYTDILIDGLYIDTLNDGLSGRGSSNQRVHLLTKRYQTIAEHYYHQTQRAVEVHVLEAESMLVGIPGREMLQQWQAKIFNGTAKK